MKLTSKQLKIYIMLIFKEKIPIRITQIQLNRELRKQSSDGSFLPSCLSHIGNVPSHLRF